MDSAVCAILCDVPSLQYAGNREETRQLRRALSDGLAALAGWRNCRVFVCALREEPELAAAEAVLRLRATTPGLQLWAVVRPAQADHWTAQERERFYDLLLQADRAQTHDSKAQQLDAVVQAADIILAVFSRPAALRAPLRLARRLGKTVLQLDPLTGDTQMLDIV